MVGEIFQLCSLFLAKASASLISNGIIPLVTAPLLFCPGLTYKVLPPRSSMLSSNAFSALDPRPITAITAAVPIIIASEVKNDLVALDLIEIIADVKDSLINIIQN